MDVIIRFFRVEDELLAGEVAVSGLSLADLQSLFSAPKNDPMYDSYPISKELAQRLSSFSDFCFDFGRYDYFLERDA